MTRVEAFRQWLDSADNPLRRSSDLVQHHTRDALYAAFLAGCSYQLDADEKMALAALEAETTGDIFG
jgi:hypothetical protein